MKIRILKPEEVAQWKTATRYQEAQSSWVKAQEDKGVKDSGIVMEKINAIMGD